MIKEYNKVLKLIIGDETYKAFLNTLFEDVYDRFPDIRIDNIELLLNSFSKIILSLALINDIRLHVIQIKLIENITININMEDFLKNYKKYIEEVKKFKEDILFKN